MKQRLLVAAIGVPLLLVVLLVLPPIATAILAAAIAGAAAYELLHTAAKKPKRLYVLTILCAVVTVMTVFAATGAANAAWALRAYPAFAFLYVVALFYEVVHLHGTSEEIPFKDLAVCVVAGFVFPAMYGCIALLRGLGTAYVLMPFVVAFIGDSFSMFAGMIFGGKKMAPRVSPKKTWAGGIGGPIGSALGMVILGLIARAAWSMELPLWYLAVIGVAANIFGQLGDLSMSVIKREACIKDYSHIFLTHGGVLDRFDSTMFIAPVVYGMVMWMGGIL